MLNGPFVNYYAVYRRGSFPRIVNDSLTTYPEPRHSVLSKFLHKNIKASKTED
jgi:hypothetical protein